MRLWPDTLTGRTLALLISMTLVLIVGSAFLLLDERHERFDERNRYYLIKRVTTLVNLMSDASDEERQRIIEKVSDEKIHIEISDQALITTHPRHPIERMINHELRKSLRIREKDAIRVQVILARKNNSDNQSQHERPGRQKFIKDLEGMSISVRLWDDNWLNLNTEKFDGPPPWASKTLQLFSLLFVLLIISGIIIARRMALPMSQLAKAADEFGLGHSHKPLPETGPREVRHTIRAFNRMQQRLHKHITDRSQMLAAVSHDLRTPITTLRLRAEYIEDTEIRERTLATLQEMESILSATLSFARDEAVDEKSRATDLAALLQSLIDDHSDLGGQASYKGPEKTVFTCRPVSLRRALNNLIENALKYGGIAKTELEETKTEVVITIQDNGPGIPEDKLEEVFTPFFRLESSRNTDTGGTGLGLAVAKSIVIAHGGTITLQNMDDSGLLASIKLPK